MAYIRGEAREQTTMFPVTLDELISEAHMCRVIEAFVERLDMAKLGFVRPNRPRRGVPATIRAICRSYICVGYLQQVRSSRRLEAEYLRNVEAMWLLNVRDRCVRTNGQPGGAHESLGPRRCPSSHEVQTSGSRADPDRSR
jgi:transposase